MGCPCKESWVKTYGSSNGNCAHVLHQYMIVNGESAPFDKTKYVCCEEGRLVRANSVRNAIFAVSIVWTGNKNEIENEIFFYFT